MIFTVILRYRKSKSTEITELVAKFGLEDYFYRIKLENIRKAPYLWYLCSVTVYKSNS